MSRKIYAAILGAGTVGTGVYKLCQSMKDDVISKTGAELVVKKVLVRNLDKDRDPIDRELLTDNWKDIIEDKDIEIVIELMGGTTPAKQYILEALEAGKQVVTANKDLLAEHGEEVMGMADKMHADLQFEAAVAGAIPIIRPLKQSMAGNNITEIIGIVNGTTNYILTKMTESGMNYKDALAKATELGYAEADPTADVEGYDAGRKMAIMSSIAFNSRVTFNQVYTEGITKITAEDIKYAKEFGYVIKLLGLARNTPDGIEVKVHPMLIDENHPLATVRDSFNAVFIKGNAVGDLMFYGRGAGDLPTGSAVVADIISVIRDEIASKENSRSAVKNELWKKELMDISEVESRYYIRLSVEDKPGVLADLTAILGYNKVSLRSVMQKGKSRSADGGVILVLTTHHTTEADVKASLETMKKLESVKSIDNLIRIEDFTR